MKTQDYNPLKDLEYQAGKLRRQQKQIEDAITN